MNEFISALEEPIHNSLRERSSFRLERVLGTSIGRSFIPRLAAGDECYYFPKFRYGAYTKMSSYQDFIYNIVDNYFNMHSNLFSYKNIPEFSLDSSNGVIFERVSGRLFPVIHFLITENTRENPYYTESRRYFLSTEMFRSDRFKYIYRHLFNNILSEDSDASIVIVDNIFSLMYDRIEIPKFDDLETRLNFEQSLLSKVGTYIPIVDEVETLVYEQ